MKSKHDFRFSILRLGSGQVLDFRLGETMNQRFAMVVLAAIVVATLVFTAELFAAAASHKAVFTFGGLNERSGILWVARDAGIFQKHGIDPTIVNVRNAQV